MDFSRNRKRKIKGETMQSLRELYKIGNGPSSSHTMGPKRAVQIFKKKHPNATNWQTGVNGIPEGWTVQTAAA